MILLELSETQMASFDKEPEAGMSTHFARIDEEVGFVLGGRVLTLLHTDGEGRSQSDELCNRLWFGRAPLGGSSEASIAEGKRAHICACWRAAEYQLCQHRGPTCGGFYSEFAGLPSAIAFKAKLYVRASTLHGRHPRWRCLLSLRTLGNESKWYSKKQIKSSRAPTPFRLPSLPSYPQASPLRRLRTAVWSGRRWRGSDVS